MDDQPDRGPVPLSSLPRPSVTVDDEGRVLARNEAAEALLREHAEAVPETLGSLPASDSDEFETSLSTALADADRSTVTVELGDGAHLELSVGPGDGNRVVAIEEVTEHAHREERTHFLETIVRSMPDPAYGFYETAELALANPALMDVHGADVDRILYTRLEDEALPTAGTVSTAEDFERARDLVIEMLKADAPSEEKRVWNQTLMAQDGRRIPTENHMALVLDNDGEYIGQAGVMKDVREKTQRRENLAVFDRALRHNLRNELAIVDGHADHVADAVDDPELVDSLERIRAASRRLNALSEKVRRLREVIKNETTDEHHVGETIEEVIDRLSATYPDVEFDVVLEADPTAVASPSLPVALTELVENAAKHNVGSDQRVEVRVLNEQDLPAETSGEIAPKPENDAYLNDRLVIQVRDNGPGIPDAERRALKEDSEVTQLSHGEGLGLWTAEWIVELSGGTLVLQEDDEGTTVSMTLKRPGSPPVPDFLE